MSLCYLHSLAHQCSPNPRFNIAISESLCAHPMFWPLCAAALLVYNPSRVVILAISAVEKIVDELK